jgi:hypothetical protein
MPICQQCSTQFPVNWKNPETGKMHNLCNRKFCLTCSPFGQHNTKQLNKLQINPDYIECPQCKITKPLISFYVRSDRPGKKAYSYCKDCHNKNMQARQKSIKQQCVDYKGSSCQICGYSKYIGALEFHHTNEKEEKQFSIAQHRNSSFAAVKAELDKCVLLCANCHREVHANLAQL